jgi:hypothetical protein
MQNQFDVLLLLLFLKRLKVAEEIKWVGREIGEICSCYGGKSCNVESCHGGKGCDSGKACNGGKDCAPHLRSTPQLTATLNNFSCSLFRW